METRPHTPQDEVPTTRACLSRSFSPCEIGRWLPGRNTLLALTVVEICWLSSGALRAHDNGPHHPPAPPRASSSWEIRPSPTPGPQSPFSTGRSSERQGVAPLNHAYRLSRTQRTRVGMHSRRLSPFYNPLSGMSDVAGCDLKCKLDARTTADEIWPLFATANDSFETIGRVLHLLQDMTSPAHVHDGSPPNASLRQRSRCPSIDDSRSGAGTFARRLGHRRLRRPVRDRRTGLRRRRLGASVGLLDLGPGRHRCSRST